MQEELELQHTKLVHWPTPQEYNESLQFPGQSFLDSSLQTGCPELTALGLPRPITGMFASVYRVKCPDGDWAVRCFLHQNSDRYIRYQLLHKRLSTLRLPFTVGFQYQEQGISCQGSWYPILKMQWCEGETLNRWLERNFSRPEIIDDMAERWKAMMQQLQQHNIAHCDLQHGNVLVQNGQLKLIDYDCMYTPEVANYRPLELGHRNYQHPGRREHHFGPWLDNFPAWVVYLSMKCMALDPTIAEQLGSKDECLIFSREDLENPLQSPAFYKLEQNRKWHVRYYSRVLRYLLTLPVEEVPGLDTLPDLPESMPEVSLPEPEVLPEWVRNYDEQQEEQSSCADIDADFSRQDAMTFRQRKRRRSRGLRGGRAVSARARSLPLADPGQPASAACTRLLNHGTSGGGWSWKLKACLGVLLIMMSGYVVWLQVSVNNAPPPETAEDPAIEFPPLSYDGKGRANLVQEANRYYNQGDPATAAIWCSEAIRVLNSELDSSTNTKVLHDNLGRAQKLLGDSNYAMEDFEEAIAGYHNAVQEYEYDNRNARTVAVSLSSLGLAEFSSGDVDNALTDLQRAVSIFDMYPDRWDESRKQALMDLASVLRYKGDIAKAEKIEKRVANFATALHKKSRH